LFAQTYDRTTWWAENIPVLIVVGLLLLTYFRFKFSNFSYFLMTLFLCYHTVGGYFTFELVPFDWGDQLLSKLDFDFILPEGRNNFDRLGHFLVGVFAYPAVEISLRKQWVNNRLKNWDIFRPPSCSIIRTDCQYNK
jgi:putative membrane protein